MKVFDNLYYVGEKEISAWAVITSAGIIVVDAIWDYNVEEQVVGGLKKLGFDPANIKYVVVGTMPTPPPPNTFGTSRRKRPPTFFSRITRVGTAQSPRWRRSPPDRPEPPTRM